MFEKKKKVETKQFNVSKEDVANIMQSVNGEWLIQKIYQYTVEGFNRDIIKTQKFITAKLSIDETKYNVDWSTLFKDDKIYTHPKPEPPMNKDTPENTPGGKDKDAEPVLPKGSKPGKKN